VPKRRPLCLLMTQSARRRWGSLALRISPVTVRATVQDGGRGVPTSKVRRPRSSADGLLLCYPANRGRAQYNNIKHEPLLQAPHEGEVLASSSEMRRLLPRDRFGYRGEAAAVSPNLRRQVWAHGLARRHSCRRPRPEENAGARRAAGVQSRP